MKYAILFFIILSTISCSKENRWDCVKRTGKMVNEERKKDDFQAIEIDGNFNITLKNGNFHKVIVEAGDNLISLISTEVTEGKLILKNNNRCNWMRSYAKKINITIESKLIESIKVNEICKIQNTDTLKSDLLKIEISDNVVADINLALHCKDFRFSQLSGTGTFRFHGKTDYSYYYMKGTGYIYADEFQTESTHIFNKSTGDIYVNATRKVQVEYTGSGDVYYSGNPTEIQFDQNTSEGHLIKK